MIKLLISTAVLSVYFNILIIECMIYLVVVISCYIFGFNQFWCKSFMTEFLISLCVNVGTLSKKDLYIVIRSSFLGSALCSKRHTTGLWRHIAVHCVQQCWEFKPITNNFKASLVFLTWYNLSKLAYLKMFSDCK